LFQKYKIELGSIGEDIQKARDAVKPMLDNMKDHEKKLASMLKLMPQTAPHFESIHAEVLKNPLRLKATEPYNNIKAAWETARGLVQFCN
jgi:hypothetical protein